MSRLAEQSVDRRPSITDVDGILVGHCTLAGRPSGCTVVTSSHSFVAGVDVRGGAPGTHETDLLRAENSIDRVDAIFLSGGSAFGLDVAGGVSRFLEEQKRGIRVGEACVPIVCGAILYDLGLGDWRIRPNSESGFHATNSATAKPVEEGNVGAGAGATVGKLFGMQLAMKTGLGSWAMERPDGLQVGAIVAVNALGDVINPESGKIIAGARKSKEDGFQNTMARLRAGYEPADIHLNNTVIGVVATNASLTKSECNKVAQMAHDGIARCISPAHTPWDGDTIFSVATGMVSAEKPSNAGLVGALAADVLSQAILRSVLQARSCNSLPAAAEYPNSL